MVSVLEKNIMSIAELILERTKPNHSFLAISLHYQMIFHGYLTLPNPTVAYYCIYTSVVVQFFQIFLSSLTS